MPPEHPVAAGRGVVDGAEMGEGWLGVKNKLYKSLDRLRTSTGSVAEAETTATDMASAAPPTTHRPLFSPTCLFTPCAPAVPRAS
jgi:hypothetical protein